MTHEELVEKVRSRLGIVYADDGRAAARAAIAVIYEALKEPTEEVENGVADETFHECLRKAVAQNVRANEIRAEFGKEPLPLHAFASCHFVKPLWSAMLSASPLNGGTNAQVD